MRVHHLDCASLCPVGGERVLGAAYLPCHCLLIEGPNGLVLVDTGLGNHDVAHPIRRLGPGFLALLKPRLDPQQTAAAQLARLGLSVRDVRDIVLTHLDPDHAGGIADFPDARIHLHAPELEAALHPRGLRERARYRAAQWSHQPRWTRHSPGLGPGQGGDRWFGFESVRALDEKGPEILLVPLLGHTRGHAGVAVRTGDTWIFHCGDAYFSHGELEDPPRCPPAITAIERYDDVDHRARVNNQTRLRALKREHGSEIELFCSHDLHELRR